MYRQKGFTIAEVLVAIAIFAVVASVAVAVFTRVLRSQRAVVALLSVSDNTSIAIEQMMREIRFGRNFSGSFDEKTISFDSQPPNSRRIAYRLDDNALVRSDDGGFNFYPVTARNVFVKDVNFKLIQDSPADAARVIITLIITSKAQRDVAGAEVIIQTTVSQRMINNPTL